MAAIEPSNVINRLELNESVDKVENLPKSAQEVYLLLCDNGALKPREIGLYTSLSNRTIRYALKILVDKHVIRRVPDLHDLRSHFYAVN
jgi:DNA-binding MarR family transcriptional regulator